MNQFLIPACQSQLTSLQNEPIRSRCRQFQERENLRNPSHDCIGFASDWLKKKLYVCSDWLQHVAQSFLEPIKGSETRGANGVNFRKIAEYTEIFG